MAADQTILFTVMPRAVTVDDGGGALPLSLFVTPRLRGADRLAAFPDWLAWTQRMIDHGVELELGVGGGTATVALDTASLEPRLWAALFDVDTFVRSHTFDDYSGRPILSYSIRDTLGALKSIYQRAGVELAFPDGGAPRGNRSALGQLLEGLQVNWNADDAERWRSAMRGQRLYARTEGYFRASERLDAEGLPVEPPENSSVAPPFALFHHLPTPSYDTPLGEDWNTQFDFHQALALPQRLSGAATRARPRVRLRGARRSRSANRP
jgi:hypothetical protein